MTSKQQNHISRFRDYKLQSVDVQNIYQLNIMKRRNLETVPLGPEYPKS